MLLLGVLFADTTSHLCFKAASLPTSELGGFAFWLSLIASPFLWLGIGLFVIDFFLWVGTAWAERTLNEPLLYLVILFFAAAFAVYLMLLKTAPVGPVYAAAHLHLVTVLIISVLYFGEHLGRLQVLGAIMIFGGVIILAATEGHEDRSQPAQWRT